MRTLTIGLLLFSAAAGLSGCGEGKTPEQIEAEKYPKVPPLSAAEQEKVRELSQTRPPANASPH